MMHPPYIKLRSWDHGSFCASIIGSGGINFWDFQSRHSWSGNGQSRNLVLIRLLQKKHEQWLHPSLPLFFASYLLNDRVATLVWKTSRRSTPRGFLLRCFRSVGAVVALRGRGGFVRRRCRRLPQTSGRRSPGGKGRSRQIRLLEWNLGKSWLKRVEQTKWLGQVEFLLLDSLLQVSSEKKRECKALIKQPQSSWHINLLDTKQYKKAISEFGFSIFPVQTYQNMSCNHQVSLWSPRVVMSVSVSRDSLDSMDCAGRATMEASSDTRDMHLSCPSCSAPRGCWTLDFPKSSAAKTAREEVTWVPEVESESLLHVSEKYP